MQPKFEVYQDTAAEWRWRLLAANGQIVATSGEGYTTAAAANQGTQVVRRISTDALVVQLAPVKQETAPVNATNRAMDKLKAGRGRQEIAPPPSPDPKLRPSMAAPAPLAGTSGPSDSDGDSASSAFAPSFD